MAGLIGSWSFGSRLTNPLAGQQRSPIQEELFRDPKNVSNYVLAKNSTSGPNALSGSFARFFESWVPDQERSYNAMVQDDPTTRETFADFLAKRLMRADQDYLNTNPFYASTVYSRPTRLIRR